MQCLADVLKNSGLHPKHKGRVLSRGEKFGDLSLSKFHLVASSVIDRRQARENLYNGAILIVEVEA